MRCFFEVHVGHLPVCSSIPCLERQLVAVEALGIASECSGYLALELMMALDIAENGSIDVLDL